MNDITTKKHMNFKEIAAYSLGLFGFQAIVGLLNSYQAEFDASILGADIAIVGILILIAKIVSAVFDPIVGNLIDRSNSRHGKFKSMIMYSIIPLLVMSAVVFVDVPFKSNKMATYVWIFVTYLIWSLAMTLGDVPSQGIASVLTPNPTERTNVVSISNTFKQVGFSACVVIVPIVCLIVPNGSQVIGFEGETDTPMIGSEYFWTAVLTAVLGCLLFALIPMLNKERVPYVSGEKTTTKDMINALKNNKPLMLVIVSYFLGFGRQMAMGIQVQAANVLLGSQNLVAVLGIVTAIGSMVSMAICPILIKKMGEKKVYLLMSFYGFVVSVLSFVVGFFWFRNPESMVLTVLFYLFLFLIGLQLTIKVCLALGTALGLVFVQFSGYSDTVAQITAGTAAGFGTNTKDIIFFAYTVMPGILALLSTIPMFKYDIVGEKKAKIAAELAARRESK